MPNVIVLKIDVKKLDKARFFQGKPDKDGHEPLWCDLVLIPRRELGRYGDTHLVKQSKKKDEQTEMPIIGNGTERTANGASARLAPPPPQFAKPQDNDGMDSDIPF